MKKIIISFLVILNLIFLGGQLWLSVARATDGAKLVALRDQVNILNSQNHQLQVEIYAQSSLSQIQSRSSQVHLSQINTKFVTAQSSLAQVATTP